MDSTPERHSDSQEDSPAQSEIEQRGVAAPADGVGASGIAGGRREAPVPVYDEDELELIAVQMPPPSKELNVTVAYALSGIGGMLLTTVLGAGIGLLIHWWSGGLAGAMLGFVVGVVGLRRRGVGP